MKFLLYYFYTVKRFVVEIHPGDFSTKIHIVYKIFCK